MLVAAQLHQQRTYAVDVLCGLLNSSSYSLRRPQVDAAEENQSRLDSAVVEQQDENRNCNCNNNNDNNDSNNNASPELFSFVANNESDDENDNCSDDVDASSSVLPPREAQSALLRLATGAASAQAGGGATAQAASSDESMAASVAFSRSSSRATTSLLLRQQQKQSHHLLTRLVDVHAPLGVGSSALVVRGCATSSQEDDEREQPVAVRCFALRVFQKSQQHNQTDDEERTRVEDAVAETCWGCFVSRACHVESGVESHLLRCLGCVALLDIASSSSSSSSCASSSSSLLWIFSLWPLSTNGTLLNPRFSDASSLHHHHQQQLTQQKDVLPLLLNLIDGVCELHENSFIHRDVKANNGLCFGGGDGGESGKLKVLLSDFDSAVFFYSFPTSSTSSSASSLSSSSLLFSSSSPSPFVGTVWTSAPELIYDPSFDFLHSTLQVAASEQEDAENGDDNHENDNNGEDGGNTDHRVAALLLHQRLQRQLAQRFFAREAAAVDTWSLGCVMLRIFTGGAHQYSARLAAAPLSSAAMVVEEVVDAMKEVARRVVRLQALRLRAEYRRAFRQATQQRQQERSGEDQQEQDEEEEDELDFDAEFARLEEIHLTGEAGSDGNGDDEEQERGAPLLFDGNWRRQSGFDEMAPAWAKRFILEGCLRLDPRKRLSVAELRDRVRAEMLQ